MLAEQAVKWFSSFKVIKTFSNKQELNLQKYVLNTYPETIVLDTTYLCNLTCKMCHQNGDDFVMPSDPHIGMDMINKLLPLCKDSGSVYLLGYGEPLMHPDIYEIIALLKKAAPKTKVSFSSNGVLLNIPNVNKLIDAGLDLISISMDGPELERGHQKSDKTYKNVRRLSQIKSKRGVDHPEIHIGFVLGKDNENELVPMVNFAAEVGAKGLTIEPLRVIWPNPEWDDYIRENSLYKHVDSITPILKEAKNIADQKGLKIDMPYIVGV
jgi:molybdenum cofactor biosynthesis enzyme MoaA